MANPVTRKEQFLNAIALGDASLLPTPVTREERFLRALSTGEEIEPTTFEEQFLQAALAFKGGSTSASQFPFVIPNFDPLSDHLIIIDRGALYRDESNNGKLFAIRGKTKETLITPHYFYFASYDEVKALGYSTSNSGTYRSIVTANSDYYIDSSYADTGFTNDELIIGSGAHFFGHSTAVSNNKDNSVDGILFCSRDIVDSNFNVVRPADNMSGMNINGVKL